MLLKDYFPNLQSKYNKLSFTGIAFNSKEVKKGTFFAIKGIILMEIISLIDSKMDQK